MLRFILFLTLAIPLMAIVAIKPREVGEKPGWSGEISGSFETRRGNTEKDNYAASAKLQYDDNASYLVWGMIRGEYGEASGVKDTNNLFSHARYIKNLERRNWVAEAFAQVEEDEFKSIKDRALGGGGLRVKIQGDDDEWGGLFVGLGGYFEYIGYSTEIDPRERNLRCNAYLAYTVHFLDDAQLTAVAYYQPRLTALGDYYLSTSAGLQVHVIQALFLSFRIGYEHDAQPAVGVKKDDFMQRTLFQYKF